MLALGGCGVVAACVALATGAFQHSMLPIGAGNLAIWAAGVGCGFLQAVGLFCVNKALCGPFTGVCIAIFGSNSVVVLGLTALILERVPAPPRLAGMALTVFGCVLVSTTGDVPGKS